MKKFIVEDRLLLKIADASKSWHKYITENAPSYKLQDYESFSHQYSALISKFDPPEPYPNIHKTAKLLRLLPNGKQNHELKSLFTKEKDTDLKTAYPFYRFQSFFLQDLASQFDPHRQSFLLQTQIGMLSGLHFAEYGFNSYDNFVYRASKLPELTWLVTVKRSKVLSGSVSSDLVDRDCKRIGGLMRKMGKWEKLVVLFNSPELVPAIKMAEERYNGLQSVFLGGIRGNDRLLETVEKS